MTERRGDALTWCAAGCGVSRRTNDIGRRRMAASGVKGDKRRYRMFSPAALHHITHICPPLRMARAGSACGRRDAWQLAARRSEAWAKNEENWRKRKQRVERNQKQQRSSKKHRKSINHTARRNSGSISGKRNGMAAAASWRRISKRRRALMAAANRFAALGAHTPRGAAARTAAHARCDTRCWRAKSTARGGKAARRAGEIGIWRRAWGGGYPAAYAARQSGIAVVRQAARGATIESTGWRMAAPWTRKRQRARVKRSKAIKAASNGRHGEMAEKPL